MFRYVKKMLILPQLNHLGQSPWVTLEPDILRWARAAVVVALPMRARVR